MKKTLVRACWFVTWIIVLGCWLFSIKTVVDASRYDALVYVLISGCAFIILSGSGDVNAGKFCVFGVHEWVEWKDQDRYPKMKRVCVDCGRIQELLYDFLTHSWRDA